MRRSQSEMFRVLSLLTKAEANQFVRSCDDRNDRVEEALLNAEKSHKRIRLHVYVRGSSHRRR